MRVILPSRLISFLKLEKAKHQLASQITQLPLQVICLRWLWANLIPGLLIYWFCWGFPAVKTELYSRLLSKYISGSFVLEDQVKQKRVGVEAMTRGNEAVYFLLGTHLSFFHYLNRKLILHYLHASCLEIFILHNQAHTKERMLLGQMDTSPKYGFSG